MLMRIYGRLLERFGPQGWWPVGHGLEPPEWEVMAGAVLTQNTSWKNVETALDGLASAGIRDRESLLGLPESELSALIRPSGYHNQKARKLRALAAFGGPHDRKGLLSLWGIGPETADSILLYAFGKPHFVVDAYTKRVFSRLGLVPDDAGYEEAKEFFESRLPRDVGVYREYHALIVRMAKEFCRARPSCRGCPMGKFCRYQ